MIHTIKDINTTGYWPLEAKVFCNLFQKYIDISSQSKDIPYIQTCADYLNSLDNQLIDNLCLACIKYCNAFLNFIGEDLLIFDSPRDILSIVYPSSLLIPEPNENRNPVIHMELNCDWEIEHGMEWIIRKNQILYVGAFDGLDEWEDYLKKDDWNFA